MTNLLLWLSGHREVFLAIIGFALWGGAYWWYFGSRIILPYFRRGNAHPWRVDMVNKKAISRGKEEVR